MPQLHEIPPGHRVTVIGWQGKPPTRLLEMGILPGTDVEIVRLAPFGDPMEIRVRGYLLSLRRSEAETIEVRNAQPHDRSA